ncbi:MAG: 3,4-dihydroxy-2-butanone-4-phosphate synthase [Bdellovibrionales bacterium]|jgi:3,4-dihydroxy 2-butanone 4-phosphate synthase/GTP cyclohydrolase II
MALASTLEIIEEARAGRMFILTDDEGRENEGDLIIPASFASPEAVNFMITHGRGLVCLAIEESRAAQLDLPMMLRGENTSRFHTNFTVSIEAKEGVTTGISAFDRAHSIAVAIDEAKGADDLAVPGHIFPLVAQEGGVLTRAGHTEAAVDVARLAGLYPAGVLCEILKEDGHMARLPDLLPFADKHGLKVGSVADLVTYRQKQEG